MNNDKTELRNIASQLEKLLLEYKNTYPKSFGQILNLDIPIYALLAVAVVIFTVMPMILFKFSLLIIFILSIPLLYSRHKGSNTEIRKLLEERRNREEIKSKIRIKIRSLKADRYSKYPDVKIYLKKYKNELKEVEQHKEKILDFYHLFVACMIALFIGGIVLIYKNQSNEKDKSSIVSLLPSNEKYIATIKPLATEDNYFMKHMGKNNIILKYDKKRSVLFTSLVQPNVAGTPNLRLMITDTFGHPISGIPIFYFTIGDYSSSTTVYTSTSMVDDADNCEYERNRRLDYLHKYGSNFRYVIEEYVIEEYK